MGQLSLPGQGHATLQSGERKRLFDHPAKDHLTMLNGLYRSHFFNLPARLRAPLSVFLKDDGRLGTQALMMADTGSTSICFTLPGYQQCVRYDGSGRRELDEFVERLFADAEQRTECAAPATSSKSCDDGAGQGAFAAPIPPEKC